MKKEEIKSIYRAPENIDFRDRSKQSIFLAGSIELDKAINWQKKCEALLSHQYILLNPRRDAWDLSWQPNINNPQFKEQVNWELNALEKSDIIIMYFAANTKSPISLLELGLFANSGKLKVVVEEGFWRKGNIDIVCEKYMIEQFESLDALLNKLTSV